ncbi:hypothetical protein HMPREF0519_0627 [Lentilactobacillus hilgardii DSM 20176 = ATCC 8290]|uniref:Uncharacterized protein n=1 Tax=Lentilactobacillus hilgardii (strain ATCC 8290 / DSM 20176 / CCUG 30140 / JCM 1155 / KCTC 3500 / NBRC 15886 / NCIMB 8040 / NRRL B-1843 / 9) TaxID=1423757 RepID=C0XH97_LENH9|nr:hypothetical protein HMPREF0519_0627 [Lentilactobacillus hilgardii DSM 20176 = ATCC 8290]
MIADLKSGNTFTENTKWAKKQAVASNHSLAFFMIVLIIDKFF